MSLTTQATRIQLSDVRSVPMRTFHLTWISFHLCFFGWFGIAPLMAVIREDLQLDRSMVGSTIIASVAITVVVRILIGPLCDRYGPRKTYTWLLILGSIPVMGVGLSTSFETFLLARLAIGAIGASFVVTQYHTSVMFAPNIVGTANATTAGWGNLGGGTTQIIMPLLFSAIVSLGVSTSLGWRLAMVVPGVVLMLCGIVYYRYTQDTPKGNYDTLRAQEILAPRNKGNRGWASFSVAVKDYRVWALFIVYAACFGIELTINNIAAIYFFDEFGVSLRAAGLIAGLFGLMNLFARTLGGLLSDRSAHIFGLQGRVWFLFICLLGEGVTLITFAHMHYLVASIASLIIFSLWVQMSEGATFGLVPFINREALGGVAGLVGAGGNAGAVAAGFLFRSDALTYTQALTVLGFAVLFCSLLTFAVRFSPQVVERENRALQRALAGR